MQNTAKETSKKSRQQAFAGAAPAAIRPALAPLRAWGCAGPVCGHGDASAGARAWCLPGHPRHFGLRPVTHQVKLMLLQILEDRYEKAATLICSQLPVGKWYEYFNGPIIADAMLGRLVPRAHRSDLKGESLREISKHLS